MFTGIVSGIGQIVSAQSLGSEPSHGKRLTLEAPAGFLADVGLGDSIALNGACMTVTSLDLAAQRFTIDISAESLARTAGLDSGSDGQRSPVNLEKALRANDRLGGHLVSGHVDGIGQVSRFEPVGESWLLAIRTPRELARFIAYKGSITVNGTSLTVNRVVDDAQGCTLDINLIPHTLQHTTLGTLKVGHAVNLEVDLIARYVERMLAGAAVGAAVSTAVD
jgi:riboflavin synthase